MPLHAGRVARTALAAAITFALAAALLAAPARADSQRLEPSNESRRALVFALDGVATESVSDAHAVIRSRGRTTLQEIGADRVRSARGGRIKVRKPRPAATGSLVLTIDPGPGDPAPNAPPGGGGTAPGSIPAGGASGGTGTVSGPALPATPLGNELFSDTGAALDPSQGWGKTDCAAASRQRRVESGGDPYRELTVLDGDDVWGERCELGWNDHRGGPTALYREGDHSVTFASFRLPASYPLENTSWQVVMQMKQTQPSANGGGTPVLSLEAKGGRWRLLQSTSNGPSGDTRELWTAPAARGVWTRFAFDVTYSQDPARGSIQVGADLDGDGDTSDSAERSPAIGTYTLKRETEGGSATDGIAPGESIPSHLRVGIYHHPAIACPPPTGCAVEIDNVQIVDAG